MDQNISVRLVNSPDNKLKKGEAYNVDMVALGIITGGEFACNLLRESPHFKDCCLNSTSTLLLAVSALNIWVTLDVRGNCTINESCPCNVRN